MADSKAGCHGCWGRVANAGLLAVVLFLGVSLLLLTAGQPRGRVFHVDDRMPDVVRLASTGKRCRDYPWLMYEQVMYSNLGNGGPDTGKGEGMVIKTRDMGGTDPTRFGKTTYIVMNATNDDYKAVVPSANGLLGRFGSFNIPGGGKLDFRMTFRDEDEQPLTLKHFALTFFDLDSGANQMLYESISFNSFDEYFITPETELEVTTQPNNMTRFQATTEGGADDNPLNPMAMTDLQKNRAVTLLFANVTEINGTAAATEGTGERVFEFVSKNTLRCARTVPITPTMPLQDLPFQPPLEIPVSVGEDSTFITWLVNVGDKVKKGHILANLNDDGKLKQIKAQDDGTVIATQPLPQGSLIGERLIVLNIAIIKLDLLEPLHTSDETHMAANCSGEDRYLEKYHVDIGDNVEKGDVVATTTLVDGSNKTELRALRAGGVVALQPLRPGSPCAMVADGNLVTVGKFAPLTSTGETAVRVLSGAIFSKWDVDLGDDVKVGDSIAQIETGAGIIHKTAAFSGKLVERQDLSKGSVLEDVMPDELFALIKTDGKLREVVAQHDEHIVKAPKGLAFDRWEANVSDSVKKGDTIAVLIDDKNSSTNVTANKDGIITSRVEGLQPGGELDEVMPNLNFATIGKKLRPLVYKTGMHSFVAPEDGLEFVEWLKNVGEPVNFSDMIAIMKGSNNETVNVTAGVKGVIVAELGLKPGDKIDDLVQESPHMDGLSGKVLALVDIELERMQADPLEKASSYTYGMEFLGWKKELGDKVSKGDVVAVVEKGNVTIELKAERSGFISAIQDGLINGSILTEDPGTIATVHDKFKPLKVLYAEKGHDAHEDATFSKFLVELGEAVEMDQGLFEVTTAEGNKSEVKAKRAGIVVARQEPLEKGDKIKEVLDDMNCMVVGLKLRPLKVGHEEKASSCDEGSVFKEWVKTKGDKVEEGDVIAKVEEGEKVEDVKAKGTGIIVDYQEALKEGMIIDDVMQDRNLAVIGDAIRPLHPRTEGSVVYAPAGCEFVKWHVKKGDVVKKRTVVATLKAKMGHEVKVQSPHGGVIKEIQFLQEGDLLSNVSSDDSLVIVGKSPKLLINEGMAPVIATEGHFKEWKVEKGDEVKKGDPIAVVTHEDGQSEIIKAPKDGPILRRQEDLVSGSHLDTILEDGDICVIGRFAALQPAFAQRGVDAPRQAMFKRWTVGPGSRVDTGTPIAEVESQKDWKRHAADGITVDERRLAADVEGPVVWQTETIKSPTWGSISAVNPLEPGMTISDQQSGLAMATISVGPPWWCYLLGLLALLACCLCCLLFFCFKRKEPDPEVNEAPTEPLLKEAGLDFDTGSEIITIVPEYRPLGIKHNNVAPIVVREFTINSYAKNKLPIQKDWKLVAIDGEQLNDSTNFKEVSEKLGDYMQELPLWPLPLDFKLKTGEVKQFEFTQRPIGVEFERKTPIRVSSVAPGSPASIAGVQTGWQVIKIGDEDTARKRPYAEVLDIFKEGVAGIDRADGSQRSLAGQVMTLDRCGSDDRDMLAQKQCCVPVPGPRR